ncbi:MAG: hypothetical protein JWP27_2012 [Flaviaesturariibacter sp.]|nr:hypothetical protein [Flaviaesturariibacter sp.]
MTTIKRLLKLKLATAVLVTVSVAAFATLGDNGSKRYTGAATTKLLTKPGSSYRFSLKSGYTYRGNTILNTHNERFILMNTVGTYQRGNATYILPLKKKVFLDKVTFKPANARY